MLFMNVSKVLFKKQTNMFTKMKPQRVKLVVKTSELLSEAALSSCTFYSKHIKLTLTICFLLSTWIFMPFFLFFLNSQTAECALILEWAPWVADCSCAVEVWLQSISGKGPDLQWVYSLWQLSPRYRRSSDLMSKNNKACMIEITR